MKQIYCLNHPCSALLAAFALATTTPAPTSHAASSESTASDRALAPASGGKLPAGSPNELNLAALGYQALKLESDSRRSHWMVPVEINGKPCKLCLDTGSDFIMLRSWAPEYLGVATRPSGIQVTSVGGKCKVLLAESSFKIGKATIARQSLRALERGDTLPAAENRSRDCGSLGLSALRDLGVVFDVQRHILWIPDNPATRVAPALSGIHATVIPIQRTIKSGHMVVAGKAGDRNLRMLLDSGAERTVLSQATAEAMKLPLTGGMS